MFIPFSLIGLSSVTGYFTDISDIYISIKYSTKTPLNNFDFIVNWKEKVNQSYCLFLATKSSFITSMNKLKNEEIQCKKVRVSDSTSYSLYSFLEVSFYVSENYQLNSFNYDNKELLLEAQSITSILNFCSIYKRVNIEPVILKFSVTEKHLCFLWRKL